MAVFSVFVLPLVANYTKYLLYRLGCFGAIPAALLLPAIPSIRNALGGGDDIDAVMLLLALTVKNVTGCIAFTAVVVQVNQRYVCTCVRVCVETDYTLF